MEYKEELVHSVLMATRNIIVSITKKVEDNVLHVMTILVIVLQSAAPQNPVVNPPCALLRAPNAIVIR